MKQQMELEGDRDWIDIIIKAISKINEQNKISFPGDELKIILFTEKMGVLRSMITISSDDVMLFYALGLKTAELLITQQIP